MAHEIHAGMEPGAEAGVPEAAAGAVAWTSVNDECGRAEGDQDEGEDGNPFLHVRVSFNEHYD
jgi:hypothetical protein